MVPVAGTVLAQQAGRPMEVPKLDVAVAEEVAAGKPKYFSAAQFAALSRLAEILMPTPEGGVGAKEAKAAEFLDFLIGQSLPARQQVYLKGLDALEAAAKRKYKQSFISLSEAEAGEVMSPLRQPWTYELPADPLTHFLQVVKADVRNATQNSKEYSQQASSGGARRPGGIGLYWYPLD